MSSALPRRLPLSPQTSPQKCRPRRALRPAVSLLFKNRFAFGSPFYLPRPIETDRFNISPEERSYRLLQPSRRGGLRVNRNPPLRLSSRAPRPMESTPSVPRVSEPCLAPSPCGKTTKQKNCHSEAHSAVESVPIPRRERRTDSSLRSE